MDASLHLTNVGLALFVLESPFFHATLSETMKVDAEQLQPTWWEAVSKIVQDAKVECYNLNLKGFPILPPLCQAQWKSHSQWLTPIVTDFGR